MVFARLLRLFKARVNKEMSELETPEILAEQAEQNLEANVKKIKDAVVASVTNEKSLEKQIKTNTDELAKWEQRATMAVQQNNDDIARQCLQKKQEINELLATLNEQLATQKKSTADLKARYAEVEEEMRQFQQKKATMLARGKAGDAVSKANELLSNTGGSGPAKWEAKIEAKEARAAAMQQLGTEPNADKFAQMDSAMQVEDELAALKGKTQPKLIVDTAPDSKPKVDPNVPMVIDPKDEEN